MADETSTDTSFVRDSDFTSLYANNIRLERSVWDMKLIFGELDQSSEPNFVLQHTAMTMPWLQAKLLSYYLELNLTLQEADYGMIRVPASMVPPVPIANPEVAAANPQLKLVFELLLILHKKYFGPWGTPAPSAPSGSGPV
jgi:hypothetical protein